MTTSSSQGHEPLALPAPSFRPAPSGSWEQGESLVTLVGRPCAPFGRCAAASHRLQWKVGRGEKNLVYQACWSPDGKRVALVYYTRLVVADTQPSAVARLTAGASAPSCPLP